MASPSLTAKKIIAVVVTFYPEQNALAALLDAVKDQVEAVVIVDNGSGDDLPLFLRGRRPAAQEHLITLGDNKGIATAQNVGINWARGQYADYVLLFDQDSKPMPGMVEQLRLALERKQAEGFQVAAVGPDYVDHRSGRQSPFIRMRGWRVARVACDADDAILPVDALIASGCLIPMTVWDKVGGMRDELFIDYVDTEWSLRAQGLGYQLFGACGATMSHSLGDEPIRIGGRSFPRHGPLRHYYQVRNAVYLALHSDLPGQWRFVMALQAVKRYGFYSIFSTPRWRHWWMMTRGGWDGMTGRMGRYEK